MKKKIEELCLRMAGIKRGNDLTDWLPREVWYKILEFLSMTDLCKVVLASKHMYSVASDPFLWSRMTVSKNKLLSEGISNLLSVERFARVKRIYLSKTTPSIHQCNHLFAIIGSGSSLVESLDMKCVDLSDVSPESMAQAVSVVRQVNFGLTGIKTKQLTPILTSIVSSGTPEEIDLYCVNLSEVDEDLLADAMAKLVRFNLSATDLTNAQLVKLFSSSLSSESLKEMTMVSLDLKLVPDDVLAPAIAALTKVNLSWCQLGTAQLTAILEAIPKSSTLENVNFGNVNMSAVNAYVLAKAVFCLESVNLEETQLTIKQIHTIVTICNASAKLQHVVLRGNPHMRHVPKHLIENAAFKITSGLIYRL